MEKFPVHMRGEVLAGMAQSAQRTGRADEAAQFVDRLLLMTGKPVREDRRQAVLAVLAGTPRRRRALTAHGTNHRRVQCAVVIGARHGHPHR